MEKLHVAIIMDGNGRWAERRGEKRIEGHKVGSEVVRKITQFASKRDDISQLTLYAFSTENWKRPKMEVSFLMQLLARYLENETSTYLDSGIRFRAIGDISKFSDRLQQAIKELEYKTRNGDRLIQNLALNYGGKNEIVRAVRRLMDSGDRIDEANLEKYLDISTPVDILIRTGGNSRISNFLLWQISYAELFFTPTLWPDFTPEELQQILEKFYTIERRFGGLSSSESR